MRISRAVIERVQKDFQLEEQASVMEYLAIYGSREDETDVEKVRLAILQLAEGDKKRLIHLVGRAKEDRDRLLRIVGGLGT